MVVVRRELTTLLVCATLGCGISAREAVILAEARWRKATNLTTQLPAIHAKNGRFKCVGPEPRFVGCWRPSLNVIEIDVTQSDDLIRQTALHEWGHVLGADHVRPGRGVMAAMLDDARACISAADVEAVCALHECEWEKPECH
jgi:hypothetical protein